MEGKGVLDPESSTAKDGWCKLAFTGEVWSGCSEALWREMNRDEKVGKVLGSCS